MVRKMKKILLSAATLALVLTFAGTAGAQAKPTVKIFISPNSRIPSADIMKNLVNKCPNATITLDSLKSDFMLEAVWAGKYRFTVYRRGGTAVYATDTEWLSNAVKDVCKFINSPQGVAAEPAK
jgi:hypothetical protein